MQDSHPGYLRKVLHNTAHPMWANSYYGSGNFAHYKHTEGEGIHDGYEVKP